MVNFWLEQLRPVLGKAAREREGNSAERLSERLGKVQVAEVAPKEHEEAVKDPFESDEEEEFHEVRNGDEDGEGWEGGEVRLQREARLCRLVLLVARGRVQGEGERREDGEGARRGRGLRRRRPQRRRVRATYEGVLQYLCCVAIMVNADASTHGYVLMF